MAPPSKTKNDVLKELRATRRDMISAAWIISLKNQPENVRRNAAFKLSDTQQAILALANAQLAKIRDKLMANEVELRNGRDALAKGEAEPREKVETVLQALGQFLTTVAKVVKFVATGL